MTIETTTRRSVAEYPQRESQFALRVIKFLSSPFVARTLGAHGCNLVRLVATMEDDQFYSSAVLLTDEDLRPRLDVTEKTLVNARRRCIEAGWMHYEPSSVRGFPSRIWVTVPEEFDLKTRTSTQWSNSTRSETQWKNSTTTGTGLGTTTGTGLGTTTGTGLGTTTAPSSLPFPNPNPTPSPPPHDERVGECGNGQNEEMQLATELKSLGIRKPVEAARAGLSKLTLQQLKPHLSHFRSKPGAWGAVVLYWRLTGPSVAMLAPDEGWPDPKPGFVAAATREAVDARAKREAVQRRDEERRENIEKEKRRQMLINWERDYGTTLDAMLVEDVEKICPPAMRSLVRNPENRKQGTWLREQLLEALANRAKSIQAG